MSRIDYRYLMYPVDYINDICLFIIPNDKNKIFLEFFYQDINRNGVYKINSYRLDNIPDIVDIRSYTQKDERIIKIKLRKQGTLLFNKDKNEFEHIQLDKQIKRIYSYSNIWIKCSC